MRCRSSNLLSDGLSVIWGALGRAAADAQNQVGVFCPYARSFLRSPALVSAAAFVFPDVQRKHERRVIGPNDTVIIPALIPHAWGTEGTEAAQMMWVYGGPDPFADSTYLEGEPPKQHA
jgi:hypothetical protein